MMKLEGLLGWAGLLPLALAIHGEPAVSEEGDDFSTARLGCSASSVHQPQETWGRSRLVSKAAGRDDIRELIALLEKHHPRLLWYQSEEEWKKRTQGILNHIDGPVSLIELYRMTWSVVSAVEDGHTRVFGSGVLDLDTRPVLPFEIHWTGTDAVIQRALHEEHKGFTGSTIKEINGVAVAKILEAVYGRLYGDGGSQIGKKATINHGGFSHWVSLLYSAPDRFALSLEGMDGEQTTVSLAAVSAKYFRESLPRPNAGHQIAETRFFPNQSVAYLRFTHFDDPSDQLGFDRWLAMQMARISEHESNTLVLDLRENGGGATRNGALLAAHLLEETFDYTRDITTVSTTIPMFDRQGWGAHWEEMFASSVGGKAENGKLRFIGMRDVYALAKVEPAPEPFTGNLIVLMGGYSFSTASDFIAVIKANRSAVLIGEETGGSMDGNASGFMPRLPLPNSGIEVQIPLLSFQIASASRAGRESVGVPADIEVVPTIDDILSGRDPALQKALDIATKFPVTRK